MFIYVFVVSSILQSQFIEKGFKKTENFEHSVVLLLFLCTVDKVNNLRWNENQMQGLLGDIPMAMMVTRSTNEYTGSSPYFRVNDCISSEHRNKRIRYQLKVAVKSRDKFQLEYSITEFKKAELSDDDMDLEKAQKLLKQIGAKEGVIQTLFVLHFVIACLVCS